MRAAAVRVRATTTRSGSGRRPQAPKGACGAGARASKNPRCEDAPREKIQLYQKGIDVELASPAS